MTIRRSRNQYKREDVIRLMEKAGWIRRDASGSHVVLSKAGHQSITLASTMTKDDTIKDVKRELGVHIDDILARKRGIKMARQEVVKRVTLAQQLDRAGFDHAFIMKKCGLSTIIHDGTVLSKDVFKLQPDIVANTWFDTKAEKKGVKVKRPKPEKFTFTEPLPEIIETPKSDDVVLDLLASIEQKISSATSSNTLYGRYQERLKATLVEVRTLKMTLRASMEVCDRIIAKLEEN